MQSVAKGLTYTLIGLTLTTTAIVYAQHPVGTHLNFTQHPAFQYIPQTSNCKPKSTPTRAIPNQMRIMHIDLDYIYDKDTKQQERNLNALILRLQQIQPNTVFLQAFADPDGNGSANQTYFKNRHIHLRSALFNQVTAKIRKHTSVQKIFAWLPLMAWQIPNLALNNVQHTTLKTSGYQRLSPFDPKNIKIISEIYTDFARNTQVDGILFHDDITLNDFEDSQPLALSTYQQWGFSKAYVFKPTQAKQKLFAEFKTEYLDQFAYAMAKVVQCYQPNIKTARNSYAPILLEPASEKWLAQSLKSTFKYYDFNAIMAMPYMEKAAQPQQFYQNLVLASKAFDPDLKRTIFELQAKDWNNNQPISTKSIIQDMTYLQKLGAKHIGYYPDDFINHHPNAVLMKNFFKATKTP